jgi:dTMP kinase
MIVANPSRRGAFVVFEGVDRCGKTTQCSLLLKHLLSVGMAAVAMRFPDRTTLVGNLINSYLASNENLDDRAIHLLFSANRWEAAPTLAETLANGETIICDRYAYSGVAFTAAKQVEPPLTIEWCQSPDRGLPAPDVVIFLDLTQEEAEKRGGYGEERYEKRDMQVRVKQRFTELRQGDEVVPWHVVNAAQSIEQVQADVLAIVEDTVKQVQDGKPLSKLWMEGDYPLPKKHEE